MDLNYLEGIINLTNVFLSIIVGVIALTLFKESWQKEGLKAWRPLIFVLVLFAVEEIIGASIRFNIYSSQSLTHVIPSAMLGLLIAAVVLQIDVKKRGLR